MTNFSKNDILAALRNGADVDALANEIAAALNEAQVEYEAEQKNNDAVLQNKKACIKTLCTTMADFIELCDEENELIEEFRNISDEDIDELITLAEGCLDLFDFKVKLDSFAPAKSKDDPFKNFFSMLGCG